MKIFKFLILILIFLINLTCSSHMDPRYLSPGYPTPLSVSPNTGVVNGGGLITITGSGFRAGLSVTVGGVTCSVQSVTATQITCITGAHASNSVNIIVTDSDTLEVGTLANSFGYVAFLYAPNEDNPNLVDGYTINPFTGALTATPSSPYSTGAGNNGGYGVHVHPSDKWVYVTNTSGTVTGFSINNANGALSLLTPTSTFASVTSADGVTFSSDGNYMFVVGFGSPAQVLAYTVNTTSGAIVPVGAAQNITGCNMASQTVVDPTNSYLFVACNGNGSGGGGAGLAVFKIGNGGVLTQVAGGVCVTGVCGGGSGDAISMDPTGNYVYMGQTGPAGVNGGNNVTKGGVSWYQIDLTTGIPITQGVINHGDNSGNGSGSSVETTGNFLVTSARTSGTVQVWQLTSGIPSLLQDYTAADGVSADTNDARFDKTGRFMFTSCTNSGTVDAFTVNTSTGQLTHVSSNTALGGKPGVLDITY